MTYEWHKSRDTVRKHYVLFILITSVSSFVSSDYDPFFTKTTLIRVTPTIMSFL